MKRFTDNGDGTVTDNLTKLIWLKDANAFSSRTSRTWGQALSDANTLSRGSHGLTDGSKAGDWRLPNVDELQSLIDRTYYKPALSSASGKSQWTEGDAFTGVQLYYYWSSTIYSGHSAHAWSVGMGSGDVSSANKACGGCVWPVRAGQERKE